MGAFIISKVIAQANAYKKDIVVAGIIAVIIGTFVAGGKAYGSSPNEPSKASLPTSTEIGAVCDEIKQLVKGLEYSDKVAQDFVRMVTGWKDAQGRPVLAVWKKKLAKAKEDYKQGKMSKVQLAKVEEGVV